jgi:uncharacterized membrane protein YhiD involved in acid resistance
MDSYELYLSLSIAAVAGLLIGIERDQSAPRDQSAKSFLGGARTHPLFALAGGLSVSSSGRRAGPSSPSPLQR